MTERLRTPTEFPVDPLRWTQDDPFDTRRRNIEGILDSYNSNYDVLAEAAQNAVDALEDAKIGRLKPPYLLKVTIDLKSNLFSILDTGVGMTRDELCRCFAPNVSFKRLAKKQRDPSQAHRGLKGVGATFLAYGSDDVTIHSKQAGELVTGRMKYGRAWARSERPDPALIVQDDRASPLADYDRGTFVAIQLSKHTRPRSLSHLASDPKVWPVIIRTRTAIGQVLLGRDPLVSLDVRLEVVDRDGKRSESRVPPEFLYPHGVERVPTFRFLDLPSYYKKHGERVEPPSEMRRQDGLYLTWPTQRILQELSDDAKSHFEAEIAAHRPIVYAFLPYQGSVWAELNNILTSVKKRTHLSPGLLIAINRQRLADKFELRPSRFETMSRNVLVL